MLLRHRNRRFTPALAALGLTLMASCQDEITVDGSRPPPVNLTCTIDLSFVADGGVGRDGIPALTNPPMVEPGDGALSYLLPTDRIIGVVLDGQAMAIPHNILWWHEIVNLDRGDQRLAVTYCPLTGSSMVFDRSAVGGAELGVSGLLFQANLMMYDRRSGESLWPQMMAAAACGPGTGTRLPMVPSVEMTWVAWQALHPETVAVSGVLGTGRNYTVYPYGNYEFPSNQGFLGFPMPPLDTRMPAKQRVLGIPLGDEGGLALPFDELNFLGGEALVEVEVGGEPMLVVWDRVAASAWAFHATLDGTRLTFRMTGGRIEDTNTGSVWTRDGRATEGPLAGSRLDPVAEAYVAFWGAWSTFRGDTQAWTVPPSAAPGADALRRGA